MSQMQTKILDHIREIAETASLDAVTHPRHANTGTIYFQRDFYTIWALAYDFHDDACRMQLVGGPEPTNDELRPAPDGRHVVQRTDLNGGGLVMYGVRYTDTASLQRLFALAERFSSPQVTVDE